jgi:glycerol-1-phosphate dehydrogenase [NAD(P)+]
MTQAPIEPIVVAPHALEQVVPFMKDRAYSSAAVMVDKHTFTAAGQWLVHQLVPAGVNTTICTLLPNGNGDVVADEAAIVQALLEIPNDTEVLLAVGSGTIHDITRFVAMKLRIPFISVPMRLWRWRHSMH